MDPLAVRIGQLLHVVQLQPQHVECVVHGRLMGIVGAILVVQLLDAAAVHDGGVGEDGAHHIPLGELIVFRHLDAAQHVGDAGDAQPGELLDQLVVQVQLVLQIRLALRGVEQAQQPLAVLIVDVDDHVGVLHVVDPGDVLIADALDPVAAEAVFQNGRALEGLAHRQLQMGILFLQQITGAHGTGGAGGESRAGEPVTGALDGLVHIRQGVAGDIVVPQGVAHLLELVEDHVLGILLQLVGLVEDLLHIGLAAGGGDDLGADLMEPVKPLLAHLRRQDGHALGAQQPAVVAGGGPHGLVPVHVELAGHQTGGQAAEGGAHLVAAGGEPLAHHGHDPAGDAGERRGQLDVVGHRLEQSAALLGLILPGDAEQVQGIHIPEAHGLQPLPDLLRDGLRVLHLGDGGDDDAIFLRLAEIVLQARLVDGQINHTYLPSCCFVSI